MNEQQLKDLIKNKAQELNVTANILMRNYKIERLLERISVSIYQDKFILKGGVLIASLVGYSTRTTMDLDLTAYNLALEEKLLLEAFENIININLNDDISFAIKSLESIREQGNYHGYRLSMNAIYGNIRTPIKIDVTTGDAITPAPIKRKIPTILTEQSIHLLSFPTETLLAEKVETILSRGTLNTRMRDFYDIEILGKQEYSDRVLRKALKNTHAARNTEELLRQTEDIVDAIRNSTTMKTRWGNYQRKFPYANNISFDQTLDTLSNMLNLAR